MSDAVPARGALFRIVAIGASAGGLEAISELLAALPADTGMAFLVVQHLDPRHGSMLSEILAKRTTMPVQEAFDGQKVEPDHVYIIAPNTSMTVARRCLTLRPRVGGKHPPMPIDMLFESFARDTGAEAIGVILSGTGSDGALGMQAIKAEGGHTFVQDDASARFNAMPRAVAELGAADAALPPREIANALVRLARHPTSGQERPPVDVAPPADDAETMRQIHRLLKSACKVDFSQYKPGTINRRLGRRMVMRQLTELPEYLEQLRADPAEVQALCRDFLINVTSFFRDPHSYEDLERIVWPQLTEGRTAKTALRVWVPGCATGEEVYSLAISLLEHLGERAAGQRLQIFGTDASEVAIDTARAGRYVENVARDVSPDRLQRFFVKRNGRYQVAKAVREVCVFSRHDVTRDPPFSRLDLVSCRNLMIYLGPQAQKRLLPTFHYALNPGGYLTLGPAESLGPASELFRLLEGSKSKIYVRRSVPARLPMEPAEPRRAPAEPAAAERGAAGEPVDFDGLGAEADRIAQARFVPAGVLCDETLHVLQFRGDTAPYLVNPAGAPTRDLQMLARPGLLVEIGAAVRQARQDGGPVRRTGLRIEAANGETIEMDLEVVVVQPAASSQRGFLFFFGPSSVPPSARGSSRAAPWTSWLSGRLGAGHGDDGVASRAEIARLENELDIGRTHVRATLEEHQSAVEELKSAQEELLSSNEEFQSTNEELETAKEELQSTNEELTTTNDELRHRNGEQEELNTRLVESRDYADAIVETTHEPMLVLDRDLRVVRANRSFCTAFRVTRAASEGTFLFDLGNGQWNIRDLRRLLDACRTGAAPFDDFEVRHDFPDIGAKTMCLNARCLDWAGHSLILLAIEDVTEREDVLQSLRSNERGTHEFLAMLGHELRNPLAAMRAALQICQRGNSTDAMRVKALEIMGRQLDKETRLVNDLLDMSRVTHGVMVIDRVPVDLGAIVLMAVDEVRPLIEARGHELTLALPDKAIVVEGDATRLEQVVVNLLRNSAKFTPVGGRIAVALSRSGAQALLIVTDNGIGIASEALATVFDLFAQVTPASDRADGGLGLGLTLVRRIAVLHGGTVEVSSPGLHRGAEFVVRLPALPEIDAAAAGGAPAAAATIASRVLVVEDNVDLAASLTTWLQLEGHEVETTHDGLAALAAAQAFDPHVVLLDIGLPGMDGHEVAWRLRELPGTKRALIIALSGYGQADDRRRSADAGFDHHLVKPADHARINELIATHRHVVG